MATARQSKPGTIGSRIEKALESKGMLRRQLCDAAGISSSYLFKLLKDERGDRIEYMTAWRIANALSMDAHELVTGTSNRYSSPTVNALDDDRAKAAQIAAILGVSSRAIDAILDEPPPVKSPGTVRAWVLLMMARDEFLRG